MEQRRSPSPVVADKLKEGGREEPRSLRACPLVLQKIKSQQPLAPGGDPAGPAQIVEHKTHRPYTQAELVNLVNEFHQLPRERLTVWLLRL